jgi:hypothetical protein
VNYRLSFRIFLVVLFCLAVFWTSPTWARLYPPCQGVTLTPDTATSFICGVADPITGIVQDGGWGVILGDERFLESLQLNQGIITWIAKYRNYGETYYTFEVHYLIYDLGRGVWNEGFWGPFNGYNTYLGQHQVKDGVVAWTAHRTLGPNPTDKLEHQVLYATYDPQFGSWVRGQEVWQVPSTSQYSPDVLQVKNGLVAWYIKDLDMKALDLFSFIYDQELHFWQPNSRHYTGVDTTGEVHIQIPEDSVNVEMTFHSWSWVNPFVRFLYNPYTHLYEDSPSADVVRRAFFVAQPDSGVVPFNVCFWDCSTALDGTYNPTAWSWQVTPSATLPDRSPIYRYTSPGQYTVTESVWWNGFDPYYATGQVNAQVPARPSGGISINNGATYTTSANVTLSLNYTSSATEMCFQQAPGLFLWSNWEPVADSKAYTLASLSTLGGTPDGLHTVSVKFRDQYNTESLVSTASITMDVTPPAVILTLNNGAATTTDPNVRVKWSASDAIGITQMSYAALNQGDTKYVWSPPINFNPPVLTYRPTTSTIKFNTKPGRKTVMVRFTDVAGNVTHTQASIELKKVSLPFLQLLLD